MNNKLLAKQLLLSNNYWVLNKTIVKAVGIEGALLLSVFADAESSLADDEGWFYQTIETIEEMTTIKRRRQTIAINELIKLGILEQSNHGMPKKRHFRINFDVLVHEITKPTVCTNSTVQSVQNEHSSVYKSYNNKEYTNKEYNKEFTYVQNSTELNEIPYKEIIEYLNEKADKTFRHTAEGHRKYIRARFKESYTLEDFKKVIDNKVLDWSGTKYAQYLQPSTLFSNKFDNYLNEVPKPQGFKLKRENTDEDWLS